MNEANHTPVMERRRLVRTDSAEIAKLRELDTITISPGSHDPIELEYDEAFQLLIEMAPLVQEMAEDRTSLTVPEFCPMCECHDATPVPPQNIARDWTAIKHWLRDTFDIHITPKEAEHHYAEHIYHRNLTPLNNFTGDAPTYRLYLPGEGVVEIEEETPAKEFESLIEEAKDIIDTSHLLDRKPTDVERDIVEALEFRETYTVSELAEISERPRMSVYRRLDDLVESRVLYRLGGATATYEATGVCLYEGLTAPSPRSEQSSLYDWVSDTISLGELL